MRSTQRTISALAVLTLSALAAAGARAEPLAIDAQHEDMTSPVAWSQARPMPMPPGARSTP